MERRCRPCATPAWKRLVKEPNGKAPIAETADALAGGRLSCGGLGLERLRGARASDYRAYSLDAIESAHRRLHRFAAGARRADHFPDPAADRRAVQDRRSMADRRWPSLSGRAGLGGDAVRRGRPRRSGVRPHARKAIVDALVRLGL